MSATPHSRIRRAFDRAASTYNSAAEVQRHTLRDLIDALPPQLGKDATTQAAHIIDVGCGTGMATPQLAARYPGAQIIGVDFAPAMLQAAIEDTITRPPTGFAPSQKICADAARLPLRDTSADLVLSSLTYQWCNLPTVLGEAFRVLRPGGTLAFTTLTPGTFDELAQAFAGIDRHAHTLALLHATDIEQAINDAGFIQVTHRAIRHTAYYPDLRSVLHGIRATGANEISGPRRAGLLGKTAWRSIEARYRVLADAQGQLPLSYAVLQIVARRPG